MKATFPIEWNFGESPTDGHGGEPVKDAGTVYVSLEEEDLKDPGDDLDGKGVVVRTSLNEMVDYCLDGWSEGEFTGSEFAAASKALATALRDAADKLDAALNPSDKGE
jgi:hypothetical protein